MACEPALGRIRRPARRYQEDICQEFRCGQILRSKHLSLTAVEESHSEVQEHFRPRGDEDVVRIAVEHVFVSVELSHRLSQTGQT